MDFKNTKPTATEFFRKFSDLIVETENLEEDVFNKHLAKQTFNSLYNFDNRFHNQLTEQEYKHLVSVLDILRKFI